MKTKLVALSLIIVGCTAQGMIPRAAQLQQVPYKKTSPGSTRLQQTSKQLELDQLKKSKELELEQLRKAEYTSYLQQWLKKAHFKNSIPTDRDYFKNLAQYIDYLNTDQNNKNNLKLAQQYKNELHIRAILTLANAITSQPQPGAQETSYFSKHSLLKKYWKVEQQIPTLNSTMYSPDRLSKNSVLLSNLHMKLDMIRSNTDTFYKSWDENERLHNVSITSFKKDTKDSLQKIEFYQAIIEMMEDSGFGVFGPNKTGFSFNIVDSIINVGNYIDNANDNDIKAITMLGKNKNFESLFQNWVNKKLDEDKQEKAFISAYNKIKQNIPAFPELYPSTLESLVSKQQSLILPNTSRK